MCTPQTYCYSVTSSISCFESQISEEVHTELPFLSVPARIEAENHAASKGIELEDCGDDGGGFNLAYFDPGDYVEFNFDVKSAGKYYIDFRLASQNGSDGFEVLIDGVVVDTQKVPASGDWQSYRTVTGASFALETGKHKLRFRSVGKEWNINWFEIRSR